MPEMEIPDIRFWQEGNAYEYQYIPYTEYIRFVTSSYDIVPLLVKGLKAWASLPYNTSCKCIDVRPRYNGKWLEHCHHMTAFQLYQSIADGRLLTCSYTDDAIQSKRNCKITERDLETEAWLMDRTNPMPLTDKNNYSREWYTPLLLLLVFHGEDAAREWAQSKVQPLQYRAALMSMFPSWEIRYEFQPTPNPTRLAIVDSTQNDCIHGMLFKTTDKFTAECVLARNRWKCKVLTVAEMDQLALELMEIPKVRDVTHCQSSTFQSSYTWCTAYMLD